jgi:hypothetical protein
MWRNIQHSCFLPEGWEVLKSKKPKVSTEWSSSHWEGPGCLYQPEDWFSWLLRCDMLMAMTMEIPVFCDSTSCRFLEIYKCFGSTCCLHLWKGKSFVRNVGKIVQGSKLSWRRIIFLLTEVLYRFSLSFERKFWCRTLKYVANYSIQNIPNLTVTAIPWFDSIHNVQQREKQSH